MGDIFEKEEVRLEGPKHCNVNFGQFTVITVVPSMETADAEVSTGWPAYDAEEIWASAAEGFIDYLN